MDVEQWNLIRRIKYRNKDRDASTVPLPSDSTFGICFPCPVAIYRGRRIDPLALNSWTTMHKTYQSQDQSKTKSVHIEKYLTFYGRERGQPPIAWWTIKCILLAAGELITAPRLPHGTSFFFPEMGERSLLIPVSRCRNGAWFVFMFYIYTNRELRPGSPSEKKIGNGQCAWTPLKFQ